MAYAPDGESHHQNRRALFWADDVWQIVLLLSAIIALIVSNSLWAGWYNSFLHQHVSFQFGAVHFEQSLQHFINDALMAVFFLLIGLEIKREFLEGELASLEKAVLPFVAAFCGMVVPALIYIYFNLDTTENLRGWAIPAATDIAFAIGIMALAGKRAPFSLKVMLVAIAVIDDLGAILIIALFYAESLNFQALFYAGIIFLVMLFMNRRGIAKLTPYMLCALLLWVFILQSGIHATLAGVLTALTIPLHNKRSHRFSTRSSPMRHLEHNISPWVTFAILPLFGFANAGVSFADMGGSMASLLIHPISLGIFLGLFVGKQLGIFAAIYAMVKLKLSPKPEHASWGQIHAMSMLCGIGFTMSLFIGTLAFPPGSADSFVRVGVFLGSVFSAVCGYIILIACDNQSYNHYQGRVRRTRALYVRQNKRNGKYRRRGYRGGGNRGGKNPYRGNGRRRTA